MKSIYRKWGTTLRWENGAQIRVTESGVAVEDGALFECYPEAEGEGHRNSDDANLNTIAEAVRTAAHGLTIERLILTCGFAEHECNGVRWSEQTRRLHLALTRNHLRVLVDTASFDMAEIERIADALRRAADTEQSPPPRLRLAPNVTAALLPLLPGLAPPNVTLLQTAGGLDGRGMPIVEAASGWPNWYRPSYRVRPVRAPLNLRLECEVTVIDAGRPVAVALLAPVRGLLFRALVDDGVRAWPAAVRLTRIDAVAAERIWYPYGAGSFGAEMML